ncbi:MAG: hypothetical protein ACLPJJ_01760 [Acidocella sp.]|uniref:hypothetical protein n=1 Tax=Acidocella sp. TaxID=50710 RepID=UPI003FD8EA14
MLYSHFLKYTTATGLIFAFPSAQAAHAAPSPLNIGGEIAIPGAIQLTPAQLANIRGGFDFGPSFSIDFAFQQIDTVNGVVVQSIMVPQVTLTSPSAGTSSSAGVPITVTNSNGSTNTFTPPSGSNVTLTNSANAGLTSVVSNLGGSGISNVISNEANNAMVSVATTANIGITGMSQWLMQQQIHSSIQNSLAFSNGGFK